MVDGKFYTPDDLRHLGDKNPDLKLARVGNALRLESSKYLFWVILDSNSKVKVGVSEELSGQISGLCGYMDGLMDNDQQITDGNASKSTHEFGDSWKISDIIEYNSQVYILLNEFFFFFLQSERLNSAFFIILIYRLNLSSDIFRRVTTGGIEDMLSNRRFIVCCLRQSRPILHQLSREHLHMPNPSQCHVIRLQMPSSRIVR